MSSMTYQGVIGGEGQVRDAVALLRSWCWGDEMFDAVTLRTDGTASAAEGVCTAAALNTETDAFSSPMAVPSQKPLPPPPRMHSVPEKHALKRGACVLCGRAVYADQEREATPDGSYAHVSCIRAHGHTPQPSAPIASEERPTRSPAPRADKATPTVGLPEPKPWQDMCRKAFATDPTHTLSELEALLDEMRVQTQTREYMKRSTNLGGLDENEAAALARAVAAQASLSPPAEQAPGQSLRLSKTAQRSAIGRP